MSERDEDYGVNWIMWFPLFIVLMTTIGRLRDNEDARKLRLERQAWAVTYTHRCAPAFRRHQRPLIAMCMAWQAERDGE